MSLSIHQNSERKSMPASNGTTACFIVTFNSSGTKDPQIFAFVHTRTLKYRCSIFIQFFLNKKRMYRTSLSFFSATMNFFHKASSVVLPSISTHLLFFLSGGMGGCDGCFRCEAEPEVCGLTQWWRGWAATGGRCTSLRL